MFLNFWWTLEKYSDEVLEMMTPEQLEETTVCSMA